MKTFEEKIEEILTNYANYIYYDGDPMRDPTGTNHEQAISQLKSLFREQMLGLIGFDDLDTLSGKYNNVTTRSDYKERNELRAEQRKNLLNELEK